jgi:hypothetical protein
MPYHLATPAILRHYFIMNQVGNNLNNLINGYDLLPRLWAVICVEICSKNEIGYNLSTLLEVLYYG